MGDDAGMECVEENGVVRAYASYIIARPILAATRDDIVSRCKIIPAMHKKRDFQIYDKNIRTPNTSLIVTPYLLLIILESEFIHLIVLR